MMLQNFQQLQSGRTHRSLGFTIVELLIVVVIIGVLAAIVTVAYNGVTARAQFSKLQSDLGSINKALKLYHAQNGSYPQTYLPAASTVWRYSCEIGITNFIPELNTVMSKMPQAPCSLPGDLRDDTWIYTSDGINYKLMHIRPASYVAGQVPAQLQDPNRFSGTSTAGTWGYWTPAFDNK